MPQTLEARQKEVKDLLSTADDGAFVLYFFEKNKTIKSRFSIHSFDDYVNLFKKRLGDKRKNKIKSLYEKEKCKYAVINSAGFIMNSKMPEFLGIDKKIYQKIMKNDNFLKPAGFKTFSKWGKVLQTPYFNYDEALHFKNIEFPPILKNRILSNDEVRKIKFSFFCENYELENVKFIPKYGYNLSDINFKFARLRIYEKLNIGNLNFDIYCEFENPAVYASFKDDEIAFYNQEIAGFVASHKKNIEVLKDTILSDIEANLYSFEDLNVVLCDFVNHSILFERFTKEFNKKRKKLLIEKKSSLLRCEFDLKNYHNTFPLARSIVRNINVICGPTNSGKTYEAIEALKNAESGVYLAPLRLMAMEIFDKLNNAGVPCSLKTGDNEVVVPGAKHIASTVECLDLSQFYEVAVIDEFQMLADKQRGWAWTQAILGVFAKDVYVVGNSSAKDVVLKALSKTNDSVSIVEKKRYSKLEVLHLPVLIDDIQPGDAVVAFSRNKVILWAEYLKSKGYAVSVIYGGLAPEVRRKQAQLFLDGVTDVLVSTDAIGMGLNLPIKRVLFTTLEKYNGSFITSLTATEVKQIAGRAGRYQENGLVGVLKDVHRVEVYYDYNGQVVVNERSRTFISLLKKMLEEKDEVLEKMAIAPSNYHLEKISSFLNRKSILDVLEGFKNTLDDNELYYPASLEHIQKIILPHDKEILDLDVVLQYNIGNTPVDDISLTNVKKMIFETFVNKKQSGVLNWISRNRNCIETYENNLRVLTAIAYVSQFNKLINTNNLNEKRSEFSNFINEHLSKKFRQSIEYREHYRKEKDKKIERRKKKLILYKTSISELERRKSYLLSMKKNSDSVLLEDRKNNKELKKIQIRLRELRKAIEQMLKVGDL